MRHNTYLLKTLSVFIFFLFSINSFAQNDAHQKGKFHNSATSNKDYPKGISIYSADANKLSEEWHSNNFSLLESKGKKSFSTGKYLPNTTYLAYSPSIELPEVGDKDKLVLEMNEKFKTESYYDFLRILISSDNGVTWNTLYTDFGKTKWRTNYIDLTRYAGKNIQIALKLETDDSVESDGWDIAEINIFSTLQMSTRGIIQQQRVSSFEILEVYTDNYPEAIFVDFTAKDAAGNFVSGLSVSDIMGEDNGKIIGSCEKLVESAYGQQQGVDFVFLMDNSSSMSASHRNVAANIDRMVNNIVSRGYNARFALVRYGMSANSGAPVVEPNTRDNTTAFYYGSSEKQAFIDMWNTKNVVAGSIEPSYWAVETAVTSPLIQFRSGALKVIVLITDERVEDGRNHCHVSKNDAINLLVNAGAQFYAITPTNQFFRTDFEALCTATNGVLYPDIYNDFSTVFDNLILNATEKYTFRYCPESVMDPIDPNFCIPMELKLKNRQQYGDIACYYPTPLPRVVRTQATINLDGVTQPQRQAVAVGIEILDVTDIAGVSADLYYRRTDGNSQLPSFTGPLALSNVSGTHIFSGIIPNTAVEPYNIEYYFQVSGFPNNRIVRSPTELEEFFAWTFPVDPNVAPEISGVQIVPAAFSPCSPVTIKANVVDNTDRLESVKLYYKPALSLSGWIAVDMVNTGGNAYEYTIDAQYIDDLGLSYFIYARDNHRTISTKGTPEIPEQLYPQYIPSNFEPVDLAILNTANIKLHCTSMNSTDTIKAYFINDCGQLQEGGMGTDDGSGMIFLRIYGNDNNTLYKNGFEIDEEVHFKLIRDGKDFTLSFITPAVVKYNPGYPAGYIISADAVGEAIIEVRGNGVIVDHNSIPITANLTNFGNTPQGQAITNTFYIFNRGCEDLTIQDISIGDNNNFRMTNISSSLIPANGSAYFNLTYNGYISAQTTVSILNNGQINPYKFDISGQVGTSAPYSIYPNPVSRSTGTFNVEWEIPSGSRQAVSILIFDSMGNLMGIPLTPTVFLNGTHTYPCDISGMSSGTYVLYVSVGDFTGTETLIIN